jgi:aspartyl-tRNA(Asn)/glutamyl-tRNA(Gln) amidotransferase subunit A
MSTATEMARALARGETTAEALTEAALARQREVDGKLRSFVSVAEEGARETARESDRRRRMGAPRSVLDGIPVGIKDNIAVCGLPRTNGTRAFPQPQAADATATARLRAAGAVILGTLNMHEGALGATTDNPFWGRCENPLAPGHTPGGSSGGSAAAVAGGIVPLSLGTDTMGSVRIPAAYCGLWGLKPTRGLIPTTGLAPLSWTLDTIGPLASSPDDLALALSVLAGFDAADPWSLRLPTEWSLDTTEAAARGLRLGVPDVAQLAECEPVVLAAMAELLERLREAGATLVPTEIEGWDPGTLRRAGLLVSEAEASEFLGPVMDRDPSGFSPEFRSMVSYGRSAPGSRVAAAYRRLATLAAQARRSLDEYDALLLPTAPQRAFLHGSTVPANQADLTALANAAGVPALALPLPSPDGGLPTSVQVLGRAFSELRLLTIGRLVVRLLR